MTMIKSAENEIVQSLLINNIMLIYPSQYNISRRIILYKIESYCNIPTI